MRIVSLNNPYLAPGVGHERPIPDASGAFTGRLGSAETVRKDSPNVKLIPMRRISRRRMAPLRRMRYKMY